MSRTSERLAEALEELIGEVVADNGISEDKVSEMIGDATISCDNVDGLERLVEEKVGEANIPADQADGLGDAIKDYLDTERPGDKIDVDQIDGFEKAVIEVIGSGDPKLNRVMKDLLNEVHADDFADKVVLCLADSRVQSELDLAVKKSLLRLFNNLLGLLPQVLASGVPVAQPVTQAEKPNEREKLIADWINAGYVATGKM